MPAETLLTDILGIDVFDTHTHLNQPGVPIAARDFWDIAHYFWFERELVAAGYPATAKTLPAAERIEAFIKAFHATKNTAMNWVVRRIFTDLYGCEIAGAASVRAADEAVRETSNRPDWPRKVLDRLFIRHVVTNSVQTASLPGLPGVGRAVPTGAGADFKKLKRQILGAAGVAGSTDQRAAGARAAGEIAASVENLASARIRGARAQAGPFDRLGAAAYELPCDLPASGASVDQVDAFLAKALFTSLAGHGMFAQFFLGIQPGTAGVTVPINDTARIPNLHGLFAAYPACGFELVVGSDLSNLDAVQAALLFENVFVGGLWWYNFRPSTYHQSMQYRLEALPPSKCSIVASDARCVEWCFGKILLIKHLLAEFLDERIRRGWLDRAEALRVAREWLHDAAARRYVVEP